MGSRDFAIVIGIEVYGNPNHKGLGNARGADEDARRIHEWLTQYEGIPKKNIVFLCSGKIAEHLDSAGALREDMRPVDTRLCKPEVEFNIWTNLISIIEAAITKEENKGQPLRRLILYFAGHGSTDRFAKNDSKLYGSRLHIDKPRREKLLHLFEIVKFFTTRSWFRELVLLVDACRKMGESDEHSKYPDGIPSGWLDTESLTPSADTVLVRALAVQANRKTFGKLIGGVWRGPFTYFFLHAIAWTAPNDAGRVPVDSAQATLQAALRHYYAGSGCALPSDPEWDYGEDGRLVTFGRPQATGRVKVFFRLDQDPLLTFRHRFDLRWELDVRSRDLPETLLALWSISREHESYVGPFEAEQDVIYQVTLRAVSSENQSTVIATVEADFPESRTRDFKIRPKEAEVLSGPSHVLENQSDDCCEIAGVAYVFVR